MKTNCKQEQGHIASQIQRWRQARKDGKGKTSEEEEPNCLSEVKRPVTDNDWWEVFNKLATVLSGVQKELKDLKENQR